MSRLTAIIVAAGIAMLAGLFLLLRPSGEVEPSPVGATREFALQVRDGRLATGPALLQVRQGDAVRLSVTSNRDDELHLHGYDLELALRSDQTAVLEFAADRSGHFDLELHEAHAELGALEVLPR
jgi:hypothetical protein